MIINDETVERAARALNLEAGRLRGLAFEDDWETLTETERGGWRLCARKALEAVQEALQDGRNCPICGRGV
jgi:hypothetical protein